MSTTPTRFTNRMPMPGQHVNLLGCLLGCLLVSMPPLQPAHAEDDFSLLAPAAGPGGDARAGLGQDQATLAGRSANSAGGKQKRADWPRTFTGQPDFEFTRAEILQEQAKQAGLQGVAQAPAPTLSDLLEDQPLDPLGLEAKPEQATADQPETAALTPITAGAASGPAAATLQGLPSMNAPEVTDLNEFSNSLLIAVSDYMSSWQPDLQRYSFNDLLNQLKLESVVVSPLRYAVINGQRYHAGDRFQMPVTLSPSDMDLIGVVKSHLPPEGSLPPETLRRYEDAADTAIQQVATDRQSNPQRYESVVSVPVSVLEIESRKVVILLNGTRHELSIKYAL